MDVFSRAAGAPMRLHALILAQLAGAPCFALSYDPGYVPLWLGLIALSWMLCPVSAISWSAGQLR